MSNGIDCATPLNAALAGQFAKDGNSFVCRYLVPSGWKRLTREEAEAISQAGMQIVSVFETTSNRALGGAAAGMEDGQTALQVAQAIGQPLGSTIYFAVDFDATAQDLNDIENYLRAADSVTPGFHIGVYGSYSVMEAMNERGVCRYFWQTYAWSGGNKSNAANIYQFKNDITVHEIDVDLNLSFGNEGWWNALEPIDEEMEYNMTVEDANKLIELLRGVFNAGIGQEEAHRLANVLRKASGQPEE